MRYSIGSLIAQVRKILPNCHALALPCSRRTNWADFQYLASKFPRPGNSPFIRGKVFAAPITRCAITIARHGVLGEHHSTPRMFLRDPLASTNRACEAVPPEPKKPSCLEGLCVDATYASVVRQGGDLHPPALLFFAMGQYQRDR